MPAEVSQGSMRAFFMSNPKSYTFTAELGKSDENGIVDIEGLNIRKVLLCFDFDAHQPICFPEVFKENGALKFKLSAELAGKYSHLYPAIGYEVIEMVGDVVKKANLHYIGLLAQPNSDPDIKTLGEQMKEHL